MNRKWQFLSSSVAFSVLLSAPLAIAHHSFAAEFDSAKPVTLKGTITKVEWTNPHTYFYVDATNENGTTGNWAVEGGAPNFGLLVLQQFNQWRNSVFQTWCSVT